MISRKVAAAAAYFGCHSRIYAWIVPKIGMLGEDMVLDQNPEYLPNATTKNIDSNRIRKPGDWEEIHRGDVTNVMAECVGL